MKTVITFPINSKKKFEVRIPDLKDKFNYYYESTESLDLFDEVTLILCDNAQEITILSDTVEWILSSLKLLENIQELPNDIQIGELGKYYNQKTYEEDFDALDFNDYWLWSGTVQIWVYSKNKKIYLEIAPTCPLFFTDQNDIPLLAFDEFMANYKLVFCGPLSDKVIHHWMEKGAAVLKQAQEHHIKTHL